MAGLVLHLRVRSLRIEVVPTSIALRRTTLSAIQTYEAEQVFVRRRGG